jgi:hypothetical protein
VGHGAAFDASQRFQPGRIAGWLRESEEARGALARVDEAALRSALAETLPAPELEALLERLRAARAALPP